MLVKGSSLGSLWKGMMCSLGSGLGAVGAVGPGLGAGSGVGGGVVVAFLSIGGLVVAERAGRPAPSSSRMASDQICVRMSDGRCVKKGNLRTGRLAGPGCGSFGARKASVDLISNGRIGSGLPNGKIGSGLAGSEDAILIDENWTGTLPGVVLLLGPRSVGT